jgi:hypothetical protein
MGDHVQTLASQKIAPNGSVLVVTPHANLKLDAERGELRPLIVMLLAPVWLEVSPAGIKL